MCLSLAQALPRAFLQQPLTVWMRKQGRRYVPLISLSFLDVYGMLWQGQLNTFRTKITTTAIRQQIFTMLDTPVPIWTLKLSNIGPEYYLDGRPFREFQVLLAPIPLPPSPADRVQSFQTLFVSIKWLRPAEQKTPAISQLWLGFVISKIVPRSSSVEREEELFGREGGGCIQGKYETGWEWIIWLFPGRPK